MILRYWLHGELRGVRVTCVEQQGEGDGSLVIDAELLRRANIEPCEQVHVLNLRTGQSWVTYVVPSMEARSCVLVMGNEVLAAHGDALVVSTFVSATENVQATVLRLDNKNYVVATNNVQEVSNVHEPEDPTL